MSQRKNPFDELDQPVLLGTIGAAQGLKGEVRVNSHTDDPLAIADYSPLVSRDGRSFTIIDIREHKNVVVVRFEGINDRNAAEALNGVELYVDRDRLPDDDLDDDEFFYADLEGLDVIDDEGRNWGVVTAIFDFGAGDILEIKAKGKRPVMIPFNEASVLDIDLTAGHMTIDPMAAGLIDEDGEVPPAYRSKPDDGDGA